MSLENVPLLTTFALSKAFKANKLNYIPDALTQGKQVYQRSTPFHFDISGDTCIFQNYSYERMLRVSHVNTWCVRKEMLYLLLFLELIGHNSSNI